MTDLALIWSDPAADLVVAGDGDLATDQVLQSAVVVSLFSNALAQADDVLPDGGTDRRGHWADGFRQDAIGSRLWLLDRAKRTPEILNQAQELAADALTWMIDDGVASDLSVTATFEGAALCLSIHITSPTGTVTQYRFDDIWSRT